MIDFRGLWSKDISLRNASRVLISQKGAVHAMNSGVRRTWFFNLNSK